MSLSSLSHNTYRNFFCKELHHETVDSICPDRRHRGFWRPRHGQHGPGSKDKKVVGPAYQEVAKKYAGNMKAEDLAKRIKLGGSGHWGPVPMPPQAALSEADAKTLATWILGGAK